jgi:haloalkane dehalogenase
MVNLKPFAELYPFESHTHSLGDYRMHYLDEGQGEPLLFLHGNPTWSFYYRNLILGLRDQYRCIAPDHIGCGLSDKPQKYPYTLKTHIDNIDSLIESLELDGITLVLHDWGGAIGMGLAVRHPEKIKRLVLFNTAAFLSENIPFSIDICRLAGIGPVAIRMFNAFARGAIRRACMHRERMTRQVKAGYLAPYNSYANRIANLRFVQDIPMTPDVPSYPVVRAIQERLTDFRDRPSLIMWGMQDFCFDETYLKSWKEYLPNAQVYEFPDAGHYVVEDAHERILPLMQDFLAKNS